MALDCEKFKVGVQTIVRLKRTAFSSGERTFERIKKAFFIQKTAVGPMKNFLLVCKTRIVACRSLGALEARPQFREITLTDCSLLEEVGIGSFDLLNELPFIVKHFRNYFSRFLIELAFSFSGAGDRFSVSVLHSNWAVTSAERPSI